MDPLSLTCNIAGVLTTTTKLISVGYSYGSSVADFPGEVQELIAELTSLSGILSALEAVVDNPLPYQIDGTTNERPILIAEFLSGSLEECGKGLQAVLESLENQRVGSKAQKIFKRVTWPLKENDTRDLFGRLERYKRTFSLALSADEVTLTRSIFHEIGIIRKHQTMEAEKRELAIKNKRFWKIISWLSPVDPETNHVAARLLQQAGTGKWLTEGKAYQNWLSQDHSFLWLHAGAGKTILSSIIIDRVMSEVYTSSNATPAVIYFYCDFKDSLKQTTVGLLGSLIAQLIQKKSEIPDDIENLYQRCDGGEKPPSVSNLGRCLYSIVKEFSKVVVIIDALDECVERDSLFEKLEWLQGNTNLLITSRGELEIKLQFENLPSLEMREEDVSPDIKLFVSSELMRQPKLRRLKLATKLEITSSLTKGANGMFRWAKCCLDDISKLRNDKAIKAALLSLPPTLEQSYERILCNILEDDKILAIRVFQWLLYSQRPMKVREVADAIATETGDKCMDPDSKLNEPEDIIHICGSLVDLNRWNMTLGLAHFTVKEYLTSTNIARGPAASYRILPHTANTELTKTCLTYILFNDFSTGPCETEDEFLARLDEYPLLRYAPYYWPTHIRKYEIGSDETLDALVLSFFRLKQDCGNFRTWWQLYYTGDYDQYYPNSLKGSYTSLYLAAEMGQHPAVMELLESGADINVKGGKLGTALAVAAGEGHSETVRVLLEKGAGLLEKGKKEYKPFNEPMTEAARNGFPECVRLLLGYGAEEISEWAKGCQDAMSALRTPVPDERENVMEVFLAAEYFQQVPTAEEADVPINTIHPFFAAFAMSVCCGWEKSSRSMFKIASDVIISAAKGELLDICLDMILEHGHVKLLKMIMQEDKARALYAKHDTYQAHLYKAAYYGQDKIIEFLLGLEEASRIEGLGISLHIAAAKGNIGIMERLLRAGANPLQEDDAGWSPMVYASQYNENSAMEKLSVSADFSEALDINIGPIPQGLFLEPLGVETIAGRDQYPIVPPFVNYSFEVEVKKSCDDMSIGFGDVLHILTYERQLTKSVRPGYNDMSWGYSSIGYITFSDRLDTQRVETFGAGDIIGCHLDRIRGLAFFTLNGKVVGKPIAKVKGKLIPMVGPNRDQTRINFGASPFTYPTPSLSAEMLSNTWVACDGWWSNYTMTVPKPCV